MKKYMKPMFFTTEFDLNETIAGCEKVVTGTQTTTVYEKQTVYCAVGGQNETVFNSGSCSTSASQWLVHEYADEMYFCWYAPDATGSDKPNDAAVALMNQILADAKVASTSNGQGGAYSGWHYAKVTGSNLVTDVLGFSY